MREETELKWAFNLIASNEISNTFLVKHEGKYSNFESYAKAGINNRHFKDWFNKLLKLNIIELTNIYKNKKGGSDSELFTLNRIKLLDYLSDNNSLYKKTYKAIILHFKAMK